MGRLGQVARACCAAATLFVAAISEAQPTVGEESGPVAMTVTTGYGSLGFSRPRGGAVAGVSIERVWRRSVVAEVGVMVMRPTADSGHRAVVAEYGMQWQVPGRRLRPYLAASVGLAALENLEPDAWPGVAGVVGAAIGGRIMATSRLHVRIELRARRFAPAGPGGASFHGLTGLGIRI